MLQIVIVLTTLLLLVLKMIEKVLRHFRFWEDLKVPCDKPHWIMGNLQGAMKDRTFASIWMETYERHRDSGPIAGFYWFFKKAVFIMDPSVIKDILIKDFNKFSDRGQFYNEIDDPLSGHLFNLEGAKWKNLRQKITPTFSSGKMKLMFPSMVEVGEEMLSVLEENLKDTPEIDISNVSCRYTTDVIGSCAFGINCNCLKDSEEKFYLMSKKAFVERHWGPAGIAFCLSFPKLARRMRMRGTTHEVEDFFMDIVRETVKYRETNNVQRNDFINLLLELKNEENDLSNHLTFNEIAAQAFVFLVAGSETSSNTMTFALYELARNQDIQEKARKEIQETLKDQPLTYEKMGEMKYLQQILEETMRLHTPLPLLNRIALEDYKVKGPSDFIIRKDMIVLIPSMCIHHDERYYPNPKEFNPDNFSMEKVTQRDSVLYLPFGDGPRNCIGSRFGRMQTMVGLCLLLKNYKFSLCDKSPSTPMEYDKKNFLLSPEKEVYLKVTKI